jgi:hypothetical protein
MCTYSVISDDWQQRFPARFPDISRYLRPSNVLPAVITMPSEVTKEEFDRLKHELEELKKLIVAAKAFDKATNQCDCETEEKTALIRRLCEMVGVDISDLAKSP